MNDARVHHSATLLDNGTVLVAGGENAKGYALSTAEIYDPQTGKWRYTLHQLNEAHARPAAVKLNDGRVLVAAGGTSSTAEIFDPVTETFTRTQPMNFQHDYSVGVLLGNGTVLVANGDACGSTELPEIYDPHADSWTKTSAMAVGCYQAGGVVLPDSRVLILGGDFSSNVVSFDYRTNTVATMAPLRVEREWPTASLLLNGKVLVTGGGGKDKQLSSTEIYDPTIVPNGSSQLDTSMNEGRWEHTATSLPNGDVLCVGGYQAGFGGPITAELKSAEIRDHNTGLWFFAGTMSIGRNGHTATLLPSGAILITGGGTAVGGSTGAPTATAEIWVNSNVTKGTIAVSTNVPWATYNLSGPAKYSGSGLSTIFTNVPAGTYTVTFGAVTGYSTPAPQTRTLTDGGGTTFIGTYTGASDLLISPSALSFSYPVGTQKPIQWQAVSATATNGTLKLSVTSDTGYGGPKWLYVLPATGNTPAQINVGVAQNLKSGQYNGFIIIAATGATTHTQTIPVSLTVTPASTVEAAPSRPILFVHGICDNYAGWSNLLHPHSGFMSLLPTELYPDSTLYVVEYNAVSQSVDFLTPNDRVNGLDPNSKLEAVSTIPPTARFFIINLLDPNASSTDHFDPANVAKVSILNKAFEVSQAIKRIIEVTGIPQVNVVGHSMGGLDARAYVENLASVGACYDYTPGLGSTDPDYSISSCRPGFHQAKYRYDVANIVTLDTPNAGAGLANVVEHLSAAGPVIPCFAYPSTNMAELETDSELVRSLDYVGTPIGGARPVKNSARIQAVEDFFWDLKGDVSATGVGGESDDVVKRDSQAITWDRDTIKANLPPSDSTVPLQNVPVSYETSDSLINSLSACQQQLPAHLPAVQILHFLGCLGALPDTEWTLAHQLINDTVPWISSWNVSPGRGVALSNQPITISYLALDRSGQWTLSRAELWRAPDVRGKPGPWPKTPLQTHTFNGGTGPAPVQFTDKPGNGTWWYGTRLYDNGGNMIEQPQLIQVKVVPCARCG
jgi:pimeloyl-ACP methyl ester carboxylesterase